MIYRDLFRDDVGYAPFQELVREGVYSEGKRELVDERKLFQFCEALTGPTHYCAVAIDRGQYEAYVAGIVSEHPFLYRSVLNIVGWYSRSPGAGMHLMNDCVAWARERPQIKHIVITVNALYDSRYWSVLSHRYGEVFSSMSFQIEV